MDIYVFWVIHVYLRYQIVSEMGGRKRYLFIQIDLNTIYLKLITLNFNTIYLEIHVFVHTWTYKNFGKICRNEN